MNDELTKRYQTDPTFHNMVDRIVASVMNHELERNDWFDAIRMADRIIFLNLDARQDEAQS